MPGSARAYMLLHRHLRLDLRIMADGSRGAPMVHQADGLATMLRCLEQWGSFGLLHDMGCGKTLTMICAFMVLHEEGSADTMFVACPSSVIGSWQREVDELNSRRGETVVECIGLSQSGVPARAKAMRTAMNARTARKQAGEQVPPLIVVTNYEGTWRMEEELRAAAFDVGAVDEGQRIKAPGSKQSLSMHRIGLRMKYRVDMTGTPVPEGGLDWYGQWRFLDPTLFGTNYGNFKARFALEILCKTKQGTEFRKVVVNPHTKHMLEEAIMERVHRVSKEEAVDLPPQTDALLEFELTPRQRRIYNSLVDDSVAWIERNGMDQDMSGEFGEVLADNPLTRMLRLQQICGGYMRVEGDADGVVVPCDPDSKGYNRNPKLAALLDLAETLRDTTSPLVVFYRFTHEGEAIVKALQKLAGKSRPVSLINGSIPSADRKGMVDRFQAGDTPFFVGQIQACSEGITLHAAADLAHYSMPFASAPYLQGNARVHRIGQFRPVTIHHLVALGTLDESVYDTQQRKLDASIDGTDGAWRRFLTGGL